MARLLVVESPNKITKLKPILGDGWEVAATVGHFRDLPKREMGLCESTLRPQYEVQKQDVLANLIKAVARADEIYLATDPDREGEAIAWHVAETCRTRKPLYRVTFTSITASAVRAAINAPRSIDMPLVHAQEARRVVDRLTGYMVSPALGASASAGRVQSPALRLLVERERSIKDFGSQKHYAVIANTVDGWSARWHFKPLLPTDAEKPFIWRDHQTALDVAKTKALKVNDFGKKLEHRAPRAPFTTSTLQQAAASRLGVSPEAAMRLAQTLFEQGEITYHRTDSCNLSEEGAAEVLAYLDQQQLPRVDTPRRWRSKDGAQEAHEAIRPTHIEIESIAGADPMVQRLYGLIRNRTLASQMQDSVFEVARAVLVSVDVQIQGRPVIFAARGEVMVKPGWRSLTNEDFSSDEKESDEDEADSGPLPDLDKDDVITCRCEVKERKTKPLPRYSENTLIKKLESLGIGRPSTFASIVSGIQRRQHATLQKGKLVPTDIAFRIVDTLIKHRFKFIEYDYTRNLEEELDQIASSGSDVLASSSFDRCVHGVQSALAEDLRAIPGQQREPVVPLSAHGQACPACRQGVLKTFIVRKEGPNTGKRFLSCDRDGCSHRSLTAEGGWEERAPIEALPGHGQACPKCRDGVQTTREVRKEGPNIGKRYLSCSSRACEWRVMPAEGGWEQRVPVEPLPDSGNDCPQCEKGKQKTIRVNKEGKNQGKRFLVCDQDCGWRLFPSDEWS